MGLSVGLPESTRNLPRRSVHLLGGRSLKLRTVVPFENRIHGRVSLKERRRTIVPWNTIQQVHQSDTPTFHINRSLFTELCRLSECRGRLFPWLSSGSLYVIEKNNLYVGNFNCSPKKMVEIQGNSSEIPESLTFCTVKDVSTNEITESPCVSILRDPRNVR